ncbi:MAG: GYD family protein [Omnitrophica bacterium RIFCSPHIGHO2_02_FULL_46_11]|nr:MAG: GYD family protein [Omnitrophica bacterium RIFCSPHIGHO2_02_FULL_46_11]OGW88053.1 MAG: GYD family protein [Omnitrophica bacterium RIFCSPLOWO2_01_FULL_45_10b]
MAHYVVLASFTDQGIRGVKDTTRRAKAFREMAQKMGASIKDIYWTLGNFDVVLTMEAPNDETATAILTKAGSLGNLKSQTLRAFDEKEMDSILASF